MLDAMADELYDELARRLERSARTWYADDRRKHATVSVMVARWAESDFPVLTGSSCGFVRCTPPVTRGSSVFTNDVLQELWWKLCRTFDVTRPVSLGVMQVYKREDLKAVEFSVSAVGQLRK